ncbi:MAG: tetratricopeptide repeat protein, partial [Lysobacterales bacterium]
MSLIDELRRRHVFRTIAWYAAAAWGLIQVASTIAPEFNFPDWVVRAVIIVSVAGFPVALLLAWAFDITRTGVKLTAPAAEGQAVANPMHGLISLLLAVAAGVLLGVGAVTGWQALDAPPSKPGIAVLAFDVLGQESNESLAGGLHEAVLGELAHISGLRVISRTSVLRLSVDRPDIRDIGRILDVPYVLEGSVQREGDQLRVHAQLIDAATDAHVWSQTYDRPATDLFGMQTALARDIALRLRVSLLPAEVARAGTPPTVVPAAYEWYLKGLADFGRFDQNQPNALALLRSAIASVDKALVLDPAFALAYAERARMDLQLWWWYRDFEADAARAAERALLAVTEAMRLDPDLGEAHRALGLYFYWVHLDYDRANRELTQARALLPNDSISAWILGLVRRRQNRFDEAIDLFREAYHLNPADTTARWTYEVSLVKAGQYARAEVEIADILLRFPEDVDQNLALAWMQFCRTGEAQAYWEAADAGLSSPG